MPKTIEDFDWSQTPLGPKAGWSIALRTTHDIMMNAHYAMCMTWGPEQTLLYNAGYIPFLADRHPWALGQPMSVVWSEIWDDIGPLVDRTLAGESVHFENMPLTMTRKGYPEETFWTFSYSPLRDGDQVMGLLDVAFETTERVHEARAKAVIDEQLRDAVAQRTLLAHELDHRIKNILSMVTAISHQTFRAPATLEGATKEFAARIRALARAQDILTQTNWTAAPVGDVVDMTLDHRLAAQIRTSGPRVDLPAKSALALALALHELATNAVKYGALSADGGAVDLRWDLQQDDDQTYFQLSWIESGGPVVQPPERKGFGTRLITTALAAEFGGAADSVYPPEGVIFTLKAPYPFIGSVS